MLVAMFGTDSSISGLIGGIRAGMLLAGIMRGFDRYAVNATSFA